MLQGYSCYKAIVLAVAATVAFVVLLALAAPAILCALDEFFVFIRAEYQQFGVLPEVIYQLLVFVYSMLGSTANIKCSED